MPSLYGDKLIGVVNGICIVSVPKHVLDTEAVVSVCLETINVACHAGDGAAKGMTGADSVCGGDYNVWIIYIFLINAIASFICCGAVPLPM